MYTQPSSGPSVEAGGPSGVPRLGTQTLESHSSATPVLKSRVRGLPRRRLGTHKLGMNAQRAQRERHYFLGPTAAIVARDALPGLDRSTCSWRMHSLKRSPKRQTSYARSSALTQRVRRTSKHVGTRIWETEPGFCACGLRKRAKCVERGKEGETRPSSGHRSKKQAVT